MKKIYLTRHGESKWNVLKKVQGQQNIDLTQKGIKQAEKLAKRLNNQEIDAIYSSDLSRAYETAKIVGAENKINIVKLKELREIKFGPWEGLDIEEIINNYGEEYKLWLKTPHKLKLEKVETVEELKERAKKALDIILSNKELENVLIVSHGAFLKAILLVLLDLDISSFSRFSLNNVSLSIVEFRQYNNILKLFNDINHLREDNVYND
ncbi:MAG TPA: histidine phosphatase family protein [Tissierellales bacterium]|nr:histidine phosphatase family protein [Tissierellales bacterium]